MAPALTAEPLNPKEKLTGTASPATGTRQSVRKLDAPTSGGGGSTTVTATVAAATTAATTTTTTTKTATSRVTRSKEAAKRTSSPSVQQVNNNKRKSTNNNNSHSSSSSLSISSELKTAEVQMGLSTAATHSSSDGNAAVAAAAAATATSAAATSSSCSDAAAPAVVAASEEHNNNCSKENSTAELLAHLSDFGEAITAEICLRKTLPEVSISKEQPPGGAATAAADTPTLANEQQQTLQQLLLPVVDVPMSEAEPAAVSQSEAAATITPSPVTAPESESLQQLVGQGEEEALPHLLSSVALAAQITAEITDDIEERLSQLVGSPNIVDISAATLEAGSVALPTTPIRQQKQLQQLQQQLQQHQPDILNSPQHSTVGRQASALLTPQSTSSSINFLKDGAANAVLEDQDIEEVLKALKTFDGNHVNPDTIDFNFFTDFPYNEEDTAAVTAGGCTTTPTTTTGGEGAASTAAAAAAAALGVDDSKASCSASSKPPRPWGECHAELVLQQHGLVRKLDFMLRRMRKMQARLMCRHASDEVAGILEWSARTSNKSMNVAAPVHNSVKVTPQAATVLSTVTGRPDSSYWEEQTKRPLPASQMSNVLRHIETAARKQQICHTIGGGSASLASSSSWYSSAAQPGKRPRKTATQPALDAANASSSNSTTAGADALSSSSSTTTPRTDEIVPNFDSYVTSELTHVSGLLHTEMREVQNAIDSDATESSSGGESADEMVNYNNSQQLSLPITRRAVWRYSRDRANIALRWSWLCTQVSDLDMKIRQHNDVYNDLCRSEGKVLLESTPAPKNGYKDQQQQQQQQQQLQSLPMDADQASTAGDHLCSRARPLVLAEFRKRKLFQTTNMHTISKKAARPSNIKCGCQWPQVPCTLCTGRPDPTAPRDLPETLMPQIRIALLDPGYHPVLSFSNDVCQSVHLEAISRQPDWQYRVMRSQAKAIVRSVWKAEREAIASNGGGAGAGGRRNGGGGNGEPVKRRAYVRRKERNNNNNKNNNSNRSNNKETAKTLQNNNNNINNNNNNNMSSSGSNSRRGAGGGIVGLVDSGNGTGTATTSTSSTTPTTTPPGANMSKRQSATTSALPLSDSSQQQQQLNKTSSLISSNGTSNNKKPRKSKTSNTQQTHSINNNNNQKKINNNRSSSGSNSRQASVGDNSNSRFTTVDSQWENKQQNSRRSSAETQGQRTKGRSRSRLNYDIDNIVIPHSMAAQNRIELLPYKEIVTPKWRIVDSDNEKNLQSESASEQSTQKLSNGCVEGQAATPPSATFPHQTAKANSQIPAETLTTTTKTIATTTKTKTTTQNVAKPTNNTEIEASKRNGIKQSSKKNKKKLKQKDLPQPVEQPEKAEQPLSNGLTNGKPEQKEQLQQQQPPAKPPLTKIINGKTKKHKIKKNPVNNVNVNKANAATTATAPAPASTRTAAAAAAAPPPAPPPAASKVTKKEVAAEILEPPSKRPKLQLAATKPRAADEDELVEEDITDEAYITRHQRAMLEERQRFETLLKFPYSKRSRSNRRVDSRAESSGANTPDPASPAAATHLAGPLSADSESLPSPLAQTKLHHPLQPLDTIAADSVLTATAATKRQERRRTTSSKLKDHDRRSATPDVRDLQFPLEPPPFEPLQFPLAEEVNETLLAQMNAPPQEPQATAFAATTAVKRSKSKSVSSSNGGDGHSNSAGSRRSSKAKATNISKLAQTGATATTMNGGQKPQQAAKPHINGDDDAVGYDDGIHYEPEDVDDVDDEEEEEEDELLLEEDDDHHHHLAPPEDDNQPASMPAETSLYNASIDAYIGQPGWLDEEEPGDDPFMDDDPNDPEWKRSIGVRIRKRM